MPDESNSPRRFEKRSNYHFVEIIDADGSSLDWFSEWKPLSVFMNEIEICNRYELCEEQFSFNSSDDISCSTPPGMEANISSDERDKYIDFFDEVDQVSEGGRTKADKQLFNVFNKRFRKSDTEQTRELRGRMTIESKRWIGHIGVNKPPPTRDSGATSGTLSITSTDCQRVGALGFIDLDTATWHQTKEARLGDLWLELYAIDDVLTKVINHIEEIGSQVGCIVNLRILAFQSNAERYLAEPQHDQTYFLESGDDSPLGYAILESIELISSDVTSADVPSGFHDLNTDDAMPILDETVAEEQEAFTIESEKKTQTLLPITFALWAIFFGLIFNAVYRS